MIRRIKAEGNLKQKTWCRLFLLVESLAAILDSLVFICSLGFLMSSFRLRLLMNDWLDNFVKKYDLEY